MKINWGGEWKAESEFAINNGPALNVQGQDIFLLSKVYRRITNGSEDNVWHFYNIIKEKMESENHNNEV